MGPFAAMYPSLSEREPLPFYYTPATFGLCLLPFLTARRRLVSVATFPILLYLCARWPCFTTGDPSSDYYNNSHFIAIPLWYLDFVFLTAKCGHGAPAFLGHHTTADQRADKNFVAGASRPRWENQETFWQRLKWATRLMLPVQRGIGWDWEVKGVPTDPDVALPKWQYVSKRAWSTLFHYVRSTAAMTVLGFGTAMKVQSGEYQTAKSVVACTIVSWAGAIWVWDRLNCAYCLAATLGVVLGVTSTREWPPLMGRLENAWSVRQMWSATYHQTCRRLLSQPSKLFARLIGLSKGSLASSYVQMFAAFGVSCLFHKAQMFNVAREDKGELVFFMSQPVAVLGEDMIHWLWKRSNMCSKSGQLEKAIGYAWTFAWFSFSLQFYITGLVEARVVKDWLFDYKPLDTGVEVFLRS